MAHHILVVEDSPTFRSLLMNILLSRQYQVTLAEDGVEGLQKVNQIRPDLVICDVHMPGVDGFQVCSTIKNRPETCLMPVILISGASENAMHAQSTGADAFLLKPFDLEDFLKLVARLLARSRPKPRVPRTQEAATAAG